MKLSVTTDYQGRKRFASPGEGPAKVVMDAPAVDDGHGVAATPKQMVLHGRAGCTGLDVTVMLERQKVPFEGFSLSVDADTTSAHPKVFKQIVVTYRMRAAAEHRAKIERAIELSQERFCGVSAMLAKTAVIEHRLELQEI